MEERNLILASIGTALGATLCCIGPLAVVVTGVGAFAAATTFEPLRPYLLGVTAILFGGSLYLCCRNQSVACRDGACPPSTPRSLPLWFAPGVILVVIAFPYYAEPLSRLALGMF